MQEGNHGRRIDTDGAHGQSQPNKEDATTHPDKCPTAQRPAYYCFVPVRLTILRRYPLLEGKAGGGGGGGGSGGGGDELVELKVEWWKNGHPQGVARTSSSSSSSGMYDDSWSRSVFLEGLEAMPTFEESLTSLACVSPEMLNCWGAFRLQRYTHTHTHTHNAHTHAHTHKHTHTHTHTHTQRTHTTHTHNAHTQRTHARTHTQTHTKY